MTSCSAIACRANRPSARRRASAAPTLLALASLTLAMRGGIVSRRGSASRRIRLLLACETAAFRTASSPRSSRSSRRKSGFPGSISSPTFTSTSTTTPGVAEPTAMFSDCASTTPEQARTTSNGLRVGMTGGSGACSTRRVVQTNHPANSARPNATPGSTHCVRRSGTVRGRSRRRGAPGPAPEGSCSGGESVMIGVPRWRWPRARPIRSGHPPSSRSGRRRRRPANRG